MNRKLSFDRWMRLLLPVVVFITDSTVLALAQEPTPLQPEENVILAPQPSIPRHRPRHLAKVDNLDVLLA